MATKILNMQDYSGYVKCGEILKSPIKNYQIPFILKCFQCEDIHFLLESFIIHIQENCKGDFTPRTRIGTRSRRQERVENEVVPSENLEIKLEEDNVEMKDPLTGVKNDSDNVELTSKEESGNLNNNSDIEQHDEFEEVYFDSSEEFQPSDESDSNEDETIKESTKTISKLSPLAEKFMKSKTNVTSIIELYKKEPNLWNKDAPHYFFRDKRTQFLQEITDDLNNKFNLNVTLDVVTEIISHIYRIHGNDYRRLEKQHKNGKTYKRCWYYDILSFLRPKETIQLEKLDSQLPDLIPEQIIQILKIYQCFPHLWDTNLIEYICTNKRHDAHNEMLKILETNMSLKISKNVLIEYLHTIHNYFTKEKRSKLNNSNKKGVKKNSESNTTDYYEHMLFLYDHEGPFTCCECKRIYTKPLCFKIHKSQHDGSMPLKCSQCNKEFKTVSSYTTHAKRHFEDLEYVCKECNKKFINSTDLKIHMLTHTGARPYCCEICGTAYRHSSSLKKHLRQHKKSFTHTCNICSKGFYSKQTYDNHMNSHLNIRSHICNICGKGFITRKTLKNHWVTHEDVRKHACELCGKTFKLKIGVLQHMRTHGNNLRIEDSI